MKLNTIDFFYDRFASEKMNFIYTGVFSDALTDQLIELNNFHFNSGDDYKKSQRKSAFLIAECFQNIVRHSDITNISSYFHIKNNCGLFNIISGNTIQNDIIPTLKVQLEQLNELTSDELKDMYLKTLTEGKMSSKGGAGLGLIEIARKTKNKLSFCFSEINESLSYFYFQLQHTASKNSEVDSNFEFTSNIALRDKMIEENIILVYKGKISSQITLSIVRIIEKSFKSVEQKEVFIKLMDFYEKVSVNNSSSFETNTSMLFVGETDVEFGLTATCLLENQRASEWLKKIQYYKTLSDDLLKIEFNKLSELADLSVENKFQLYLIELILSTSTLNFDTRPYSEYLSITTLRLGFLKAKNESIVYSEIETNF